MRFSYTTDIATLTYASFVTHFKQAFAGKIDTFDLLNKLSTMKQRNNVDGYIAEFDKYRSLLPSNTLSDEAVTNLFIKGLNPTLAKELRLHKVTTFYAASEIASTAAHCYAPSMLGSGPMNSVPDYPVDADGDVIMSIHQTHRHAHSGRFTSYGSSGSRTRSGNNGSRSSGSSAVFDLSWCGKRRYVCHLNNL